MEAQEYKKDDWARSVHYDGDKKFVVELKTDEERAAADKIIEAIGGIPGDVPSKAHYIQTFAQLNSSQLNLLAKHPGLAKIWFDPKSSNHQRKLAALPYISQIRKERETLQKEANKLTEQIEYTKGKLAAAETGKAWLELEPKLEKNDCSRLHMLKQAMREDKILMDEDKTLADAGISWTKELPEYHSFVVQHDWGKAFEGATDFDGGEIKLPYEKCIFELRISGKTMLIFARPEPSGSILLMPFVQLGDWWYVSSDPGHFEDIIEDGMFSFAVKEVKAIVVALDAEVASHHVVRAPEKLNKVRENSGKVPLSDYHIVKLAHRERIANPAGGVSGARKRLHFRRGHWRHYAEFKTWVRWTLVGNPELGFVDKEYRL